MLTAFEAAILALAGSSYLLAFAAALAERAVRRRAADGSAPPAGIAAFAVAPRTAQGLLWIAFVAHLGLLGARGSRLGDQAFADPPSTLFFVSWCGTLVALIIDLAQGLRGLPLFLSPPVVLALLVGAATLNHAGNSPVPLPERGRLALWVHVGTVVVAYGAFGFSAVLASMYLFLEGQLKKKRFGWLDLPALDRLERVCERFVAAGFALMTLSLVVGVVYQKVTGHLGAEWLTAAKTILAFAVWFAWGLVVVLRRSSLIAGRRQAVATLGVSLLMLLSYLGQPLVTGSGHLPAGENRPS